MGGRLEGRESNGVMESKEGNKGEGKERGRKDGREREKGVGRKRKGRGRQGTIKKARKERKRGRE